MMSSKDYETKRGRQPQEQGDIEEKHPGKPAGYEQRKPKRDKVAREVSKMGLLAELNAKKACVKGR